MGLLNGAPVSYPVPPSVRAAPRWHGGGDRAVVMAGLFLISCASPVAPPIESAVRRAFPGGGPGLRMIPRPDPTTAGIDHFTAIDDAGNVLGIVSRRKCRALSGEFTVVVAMTPDRSIVRVEVIDYHARRGGEIKSPRHLRQYIGKQPGDSFRIGHDLDGVSGATWSAASLAEAVEDLVTPTPGGRAR